jgi:hypothetical protein
MGKCWKIYVGDLMGMKRGERDVMWESYMWFTFGNY